MQKSSTGFGMRRIIFIILVNLFCIQTAVYAQSDAYEDFSYGEATNVCNQVYDPYEQINRRIFVFNSILDHFLLRPIVLGYKKVTNSYTRARVTSFLDNLNTPVTVVNYGFQKNYDGVMKGLWRFIINTTFGIGGLFDVASKIGLEVKKQTLGSTLAYYGVGPGPYLVIPFFGSTNARDITSSVFTSDLFNPIMYYVHTDFALIAWGMQVIDTRLALLPFTDYVENSSTDPYITIRSATQQNRESMVSYPKNFKCPKVN